MNIDNLIGYKIEDVLQRAISKKKGLLLKKGNKLLLLESKDGFELSDIKIRSETGNKE